jgi:hypothetical protein
LRQQLLLLLLLRQPTTPCTLRLLTAAQAELRLHAGVEPADCPQTLPAPADRTRTHTLVETFRRLYSQ